MDSGEWKECKRCQKQHNKLACLLSDCEIREQKTKETIRRWHKEWAEKKQPSMYICQDCCLDFTTELLKYMIDKEER